MVLFYLFNVPNFLMAIGACRKERRERIEFRLLAPPSQQNSVVEIP